MFKKENMSPDEWQFIKAYCASVQKNYEMIQSIRALMNPDWLNVKCPVAATKMAKKLCAMQKKYCNKIEKLGQIKKNKAKKPQDGVSAEDVAEVFTISFFKIVDPATKKVFLTDKGVPAHDGWSSGHPADWQYAVKSLQEIHKQELSDSAESSLLLQALLKIFALMPYKKPTKWQEESSYDDWQEEEDDSANDDDFDSMSFFT
jgi:hypothetical protein